MAPTTQEVHMPAISDNIYEIVWRDRSGVHRAEIAAPDAREAMRVLYRLLGVKRLVGTRTTLLARGW